LAPNIAAGLACLFSLVGGIIFLVLEKRSQFVRYWAMQSVFLGGLGLALSIMFRIAAMLLGYLPFVGWLLVILFSILHLVLSLALFVVYVITVVKAFSNQEWDIPWLGKLARQQLAQTDAKVPTDLTPPQP
jgi:uncharacterized membrane protein